MPIGAVAPDDDDQSRRVLGRFVVLQPVRANASRTVQCVRVDELPIRHPVLSECLGAENDAKLVLLDEDMPVVREAELVAGPSVRYEPTVVGIDALREQGTRVAVKQSDPAAECSGRLEAVQLLQAVLCCLWRGQPTVATRNFSKKVLKLLFVNQTKRVLKRPNTCPILDMLYRLQHPWMRASSFDPLIKLQDFLSMGIP